MRKLLLAGCILPSLWGSAGAQVAVFDAPNALGQLKELKQSVDGYLQDLKAYVQYVQTAQSALMIANGLVHNPTNFGGYLALGNLAGVNLQASLPIDPYQLMALTSGYGGGGIGGLMGKFNNLTNLVNTNADINAIGTCQGGTFACQLLNQRRYAAAGQQAAAQQISQDMNNHLTALTALKARCLGSPDSKDAQDCGNQIAIETGAIQAATAQLQAAKAMADAQNSVFNNRASEWVRNDSQTAHAAVAAQLGGP